MYLPWYSWDEALKAAKFADRNAIDSVWMADHPVDWAPVEHLELWTTMTAVASLTKRVEVCFGVTDPHRRHPSTMAHAAVTMDHISNGRLRLGMGGGEAMNLVPYGVDWSHPIPKLREAITVMKRLWTEKEVNFHGKFFSIKGGFLAIKPIQKPHPPIYVGAHGPKALELAAELGDGWYPFLLTKKRFEEGLKTVRDASKRFGREPGSVEPIIELIAVIRKDHDEAVEGAGFLTRAISCLWPKILDDMGLGRYRREELSLMNWTCSEKNLQNLADNALKIPWEPEKWTGKAVTVAGTPDEVIGQLEGYARAGVKHFALFTPAPEISTTMRHLAKDVIPYFKGK